MFLLWSGAIFAETDPDEPSSNAARDSGHFSPCEKHEYLSYLSPSSESYNFGKITNLREGRL